MTRAQAVEDRPGPQFTPERMKPALEFIDGYWRKLEKFRPHDTGTLVGLPKPYFVPSSHGDGSKFSFDEMYYWDSFFIAQGLLGTRRQHLVTGLVENLMSLMDRFGVIPNAGRFYSTGRSQPPFLSTFILEAYAVNANKRWLDRAMAVAKREYRTVWMGVSHPNWRQVFEGLSRFYDVNMIDDLAEAESGWDMTTRFEGRALSYLPVDLNALLYKYERDFERTAVILGDGDEAREWSKRALRRRAQMHNYLWDDNKGCYFDYNYMTGKRSRVYSLASFFPMWAGMDDPEMAARQVELLNKFEVQGGLATTAREPEVDRSLPAQWAYPNGWAPLHLVVVEALERYGYRAEAERIARKWLQTNLVRFEATGDFFEKYNVVDIHREPKQGVYPPQTGFGWTNGVFVRLCRMYLRPDELPAGRELIFGRRKHAAGV